MERRPPEPAGKDGGDDGAAQALRERFVDSMDDDFNTARAIGHLFDAVRLVNTALAEKKPGVSSGVFLKAGKTLLEIGSVLRFSWRNPMPTCAGTGSGKRRSRICPLRRSNV